MVYLLIINHENKLPQYHLQPHFPQYVRIHLAEGEDDVRSVEIWANYCLYLKEERVSVHLIFILIF